ncbi:MAG TPA: transposase [Thermoanaerobaculia bacterium]|nr:transposase [Thermoanaerobaculia bacterium]
MPRKIRHVPEGGSLVEVTCRTVQSRLLLAPRAYVREIVLGVLARAKRLYPVQLICFAFTSNHYHLLIHVEDAGRMAEFMGYLNGNLAKEVGRLADWKEKFWGRRYQHIVVSDEEAAQVARLKYILSHGAKEGLVADPREWPGAHAVNALLTGDPLEGVWYDRTQEYRYRLRGKEPAPRQFATVETLTLDPLPCWKHLPAEEYRQRMADLVAEVVEEARAEREAKGLEPMGADAVRRQQPHTRPNRTKKSPAPLFHTASKKAYLNLREAYSRFLAAFRDAAEKLKAGDRTVEFPEGSFPPALPFVRPAFG